MGTKATKRDAVVILNALSAGVVPRTGLRHFAVGRGKEVKALLDDLETIEEGGASFRFIVGKYGSGKSFLIQLVRNNAMERNFVVMDADLSPERRLTGTKEQGLRTYRELLQNLAIRPKPDGGALESLLQAWVSSLQKEIAEKEGLQPKDPILIRKVSDRIEKDMQSFREMSHGFAFSAVIDAYWRGMKTGNDELKQSAIRWLRGEYTSKTAARQKLPVDTIINDANWYDFLKLFALFTKKAGFKGLLIFIDEGVNLYKITNKIARGNNYEKLLTMYNDCMQGKAHNIGIFFSGTEQFVYDDIRGLFSYEALKSRLSGNSYASKGYVDYTSPIIKLSRITDEELFVLLERLCDIHAKRYDYEKILTENQLEEYLNMAVSKLGADEFLTPREIAKDFISVLNILEQNPMVSFSELLTNIDDELKGPEQDPDGLTADIFAELDDL